MRTTSVVVGLAATLAICEAQSPASVLADEGDEETVAVTVLLIGDPGSTALLRRALGTSELPIRIRFAELPNRPVTTTRSDLDARLGRARQAYIDADFATCFEALGDESDTTALLMEGRRELAARHLFWLVACRVGSFDTTDATRLARRFAVLGLEARSLIEDSNPLVETLLATAREEISTDARSSLQVNADRPRVRVSIDGYGQRCVTPCTLDLPAGDHVVRVEADGAMSESRVVRLGPDGATASFQMRPADPTTAADQWTLRYAASPAVDSADSMRLLASAVRAPRLVLFSADDEAFRIRLRGAFATEGRVASRAEHHSLRSALGEDIEDLLRELLIRAEVMEPAPSLLEQPLFWVVVGLVALGAITATAGLLLYEPPRVTRVRW